jgi:hypothetical protein
VSLPRDEFDRLKVRLKPETTETLKSADRPAVHGVRL